MKTVKDYITADISWLQENDLKYRLGDIKLDNGSLNILYNDKFALKIYDRLGHGFGVTINLADKYDDSIYDNDKFSLHWAFVYFKLKQRASFDKRTENQYLQNLPNLVNDIKTIVPRLNQMTKADWDNMKKWVDIESKKQFS
ncbi:MAG: hypothetical protein IT271_04420 [Chitinophagales bacterium]|nr:hypothetical protein [Chitinophagales bacterium]